MTRKPVLLLTTLADEPNPCVSEIFERLVDRVQLHRGRIADALRIRPDFIHVNWPEELNAWREPDEFWFDRSLSALDELQTQGTRLIWTRHNDGPHLDNHTFRRLYLDIAARADAIVHLGESGREEYLRRYPQALHPVIPHGIYSRLANRRQGTAFRHRLGWDTATPLLIAPGNFRTSGDRLLVTRTAKRLGRHGVQLYAPCLLGRWRPSMRSMSPSAVAWLHTRLTAPQIRGLSVGCGFVGERTLHLLVAGADAVLVARRHQLNSGIPFLAAAYRVPIIGPRCGNIGTQLGSWDMPTYASDASDAVTAAVSILCHADKYAHRFRHLDLSGYSWEVIAEAHMALYRQLF